MKNEYTKATWIERDMRLATFAGQHALCDMCYSGSFKVGERVVEYPGGIAHEKCWLRKAEDATQALSVAAADLRELGIACAVEGGLEVSPVKVRTAS